MSSSEGEFTDENAADLSYSDLEVLPSYLTSDPLCWKSVQLSHNNFLELPPEIGSFTNLVILDISNNGLTSISDSIMGLVNLRSLIARNNLLDSSSISKEFSGLTSLEVLNFSGNRFSEFPEHVLDLTNLKSLYLGANQLTEIPSTVKNLRHLEILYMGGNCLRDVPAELGHLRKLTSLILCDNQLQSLPPTFVHLKKLRSLMLHNNRLSTLPQEIVSLNLVELSLRNNPLVIKFVQDLSFDPPSLMELAGRVIKIEKVPFTSVDLSKDMFQYLSSAQRCVNPSCKGVYFSARVENVKFVDFCGKYRLPLLQYLCSPKCTYSHAYSDSETDDEDSARTKMKKVLLG